MSYRISDEDTQTMADYASGRSYDSSDDTYSSYTPPDYTALDLVGRYQQKTASVTGKDLIDMYPDLIPKYMEYFDKEYKSLPEKETPDNEKFFMDFSNKHMAILNDILKSRSFNRCEQTLQTRVKITAGRVAFSLGGLKKIPEDIFEPIMNNYMATDKDTKAHLPLDHFAFAQALFESQTPPRFRNQPEIVRFTNKKLEVQRAILSRLYQAATSDNITEPYVVESRAKLRSYLGLSADMATDTSSKQISPIIEQAYKEKIRILDVAQRKQEARDNYIKIEQTRAAVNEKVKKELKNTYKIETFFAQIGLTIEATNVHLQTKPAKSKGGEVSQVNQLRHTCFNEIRTRFNSLMGNLRRIQENPNELKALPQLKTDASYLKTYIDTATNNPILIKGDRWFNPSFREDNTFIRQLGFFHEYIEKIEEFFSKLETQQFYSSTNYPELPDIPYSDINMDSEVVEDVKQGGPSSSSLPTSSSSSTIVSSTASSSGPSDRQPSSSSSSTSSQTSSTQVLRTLQVTSSSSTSLTSEHFPSILSSTGVSSPISTVSSPEPNNGQSSFSSSSSSPQISTQALPTLPLTSSDSGPVSKPSSTSPTSSSTTTSSVTLPPKSGSSQTTSPLIQGAALILSYRTKLTGENSLVVGSFFEGTSSAPAKEEKKKGQQLTTPTTGAPSPTLGSEEEGVM